MVVNTSESIARDTRNVVDSLVEFEQFSKDNFELDRLSVSSFDVEQLCPSLEQAVVLFSVRHVLSVHFQK